MGTLRWVAIENNIGEVSAALACRSTNATDKKGAASTRPMPWSMRRRTTCRNRETKLVPSCKPNSPRNHLKRLADPQPEEASPLTERHGGRAPGPQGSSRPALGHPAASSRPARSRRPSIRRTAFSCRPDLCREVRPPPTAPHEDCPSHERQLANGHPGKHVLCCCPLLACSERC